MRRSRVFVAITLLAIISVPESARADLEQPNVVVILADDLGYADISLQGGREITTPRIDSIAGRGVHFTSGYVTFPACAPSRASLLTGRHHLRLGFPTNPDRGRPTRPGNPLGLSPSEITLAEHLRTKGYRTGAFGKWHLGREPSLHPLEQGFDEFYGFLGPLKRYFVEKRGWDGILRGKEPVQEEQYLTYAFAREAINFIERHQDNPFFVYLAFNAVHTPLMDDKRPARDANIVLSGSEDPRENRAVYIRMVEAMDRSVGSILDKLRELELEHNTLVFFLSDNGGARQTGAYDNTPLRGFKGEIYEGGIRVPFLVQWPRRFPAGLTYDEPVSALDIVPTAVVAAGGALPSSGSIDGTDLEPFLTTRKNIAPHESLYFHWGNQYAVRVGRWKLVLRSSKVAELYDVDNDIGETTNLAKRHPKVVDDLTRRLAFWKKELPEPLFKADPDQWGARRKEQRALSNTN